MPSVKVAAVAWDMVTSYGWGVDACWEGLLSGQTTIGPVNRFDTGSFVSNSAGLVPGIRKQKEQSQVFQLLTPLLSNVSGGIPEDAQLLLATTNGEMEYLEDAVLAGTGNADESRLDRLLAKVQKLTGVNGAASVVSSACASSSTAIAMAASAIRSGETESALVVAVDCVTEFVFAGFSALGALTPEKAQPFDKNRKGLSLGEGGAFILLMSEQKAQQEKRKILGQIAGWGLTSDANHMTGPSRDGQGLSQAIKQAMQTAAVSPDEIFSICAHGTGTLYNDAMEIVAFESIFKQPIPAYSIKGGCGHMLGVAGLVETIISLKSAETGIIPPTVNLLEPEESTSVCFSTKSKLEPTTGITLSTNSGFGGVNCALILKSTQNTERKLGL